MEVRNCIIESTVYLDGKGSGRRIRGEEQLLEAAVHHNVMQKAEVLEAVVDADAKVLVLDLQHHHRAA